MNLTWDKVDLKNRMFKLEATDTKEGKAKTVPISGEVFKILTQGDRRLRDANEEDHFFLYYGKTIGHFTTALKRACENAGILWGKKGKGGFLFHDLRHTFVTDMRRAGVARTVTMEITGHAITDMNARYDTVEDFEKLDAIRMLEKFRSVDENVDQKTLTV